MSDRFAESLPPEPVPVSPSSQGRARLLALADPLSIAVCYAFLLSQSWMRWGDPLVDFPKDLYIAWRVSAGDMLYQRISNWYGPLANLTEGAGFRVFGVGLDTMVWMNIVLTAGVLLLLRAIFRTLGSRLLGWLAPMVFLSVFAFGHYVLTANYNFITPYVAATTYSFAGLLLCLWGLLKHLKSGRPAWLGVAGLGFAMVYLDKPEAFLAACGAIGIYVLAQRVRAWRQQAPAGRWYLEYAGWFAGGFLCLWLPVFLYFLARGGLAYAWRGVNFAPYTLFGGAFGSEVAESQLLQIVFGFDEPWTNFKIEFQKAVELASVTLVMVVAAREWARSIAGSVRGVAFFLVAVAPLFPAVWLLPHENFWLNVGSAFVFPVCLAAIAYGGWSIWAAWQGRADFERVTGLAVLGAAASLMLARMILNARLSHYGFYLMPLAVLFWIHLVVVEFARPGRGAVRTNWLLPAAFSALVLLGAGELGKINLDAYMLKVYPVGSGRDRFYTFVPNLDPNGWLLKSMIKAGKLAAPQAQNLVVFPEGIAVNYHLRLVNPLDELEFQPLALGYVGPEHVLEELKENPPDAVFLFARDLSEDGVPYFGADEASGRNIMFWLKDNYKVVGFAGKSPFSATHHALDFLLPKNAANPPPQTVPDDKD